MEKMFNRVVVVTALLASCAAVAASNAYYRAECETVGGVTRLAGLVKVQKTGDVAVPGTWTVLGGADAVTFENGRIVIKGGLRFDSQGAPFSLTSRGVTFGEGTSRYQIGLDGKRTNVTKDGFTLEPHPNTPGVNGVETAFALSTVGESRYVDVGTVPQNSIIDFEVLY